MKHLFRCIQSNTRLGHHQTRQMLGSKGMFHRCLGRLLKRKAQRIQSLFPMQHHPNNQEKCQLMKHHHDQWSGSEPYTPCRLHHTSRRRDLHQRYSNTHPSRIARSHLQRHAHQLPIGKSLRLYKRDQSQTLRHESRMSNEKYHPVQGSLSSFYSQ